jgi:hypothetical protein
MVSRESECASWDPAPSKVRHRPWDRNRNPPQRSDAGWWMKMCRRHGQHPEPRWLVIGACSDKIETRCYDLTCQRLSGSCVDEILFESICRPSLWVDSQNNGRECWTLRVEERGNLEGCYGGHGSNVYLGVKKNSRYYEIGKTDVAWKQRPALAPKNEK